MNQLTEYYKILQRFSSLYAGEGDDELTRHAADAITPLAEKGNHCIGDAYLDGNGVDKDWNKAREWYQKGAEAGTAFSFKIPSHCREMCYFIARAVRTEMSFSL